MQTRDMPGSDAAIASSLSLFFEDELVRPAVKEESETNGGKTDEQDTEELAFLDEQLEQRGNNISFLVLASST